MGHVSAIVMASLLVIGCAQLGGGKNGGGSGGGGEVQVAANRECGRRSGTRETRESHVDPYFVSVCSGRARTR